MKNKKLILQITFTIIFCTACGASISETPLVSVTVCANDGLNMSSFLAITPEQTTETEIEGMLGDAYIPFEPLLTEWSWGYLCGRGSEMEELYITFDTTETTFIVSSLNYYNPQIDIAELINLFGLPEIVYKENINNRSREVTQYTFAYPSIGIFGSTISTATPVVSDDVDAIMKEKPQDSRDFVTNLGSQKDVEIIEWSYK